MCGIAGIIGSNSNGIQQIESMLKSQSHRGPDATHIWNDANVYLGHNRLSIIDLSSEADQPMVSSNGRYIIVFNGEIYNYLELKQQLLSYTFKTSSDTEVLLALFQQKGKDMLHDLNGMFAFVIYDKLKGEIFAARDRFGVKPFYYSFIGENLIFASEIKTLFTAGVEKMRNKKVWANYLSFGTYGLPNETFWEKVNQLPGGHYFEYCLRDEKIQPVRWYDFVGNVLKMPQLGEEDLKRNYLQLLQDSIRLRFRADVAVGFNISGGLDSSVLLALVNNEFPNNNAIEAFTFYTNDYRYDELHWVELMLEKTKKPLNKCLLKVDDVPQLIKKIATIQDEPFGGFPTLAYSQIFATARKRKIVVLLDGQGMDEAWAGYDYYQTKTGFTIQGTKTTPVRPEVLTEEYRAYASKEVYETPFDNDLQNLQYRDLFYTKIPRALRFNDRISMMHGTELREPFLDYRLVELAFSQNETVKIKNGQGKWLLRELMKDLLGSEVALAPKRPLQTPQREWMASDLLEYITSKIENFSNSDLVKKDKVLSLWDEYQNGNQENSFYIWQWINLNEMLYEN
ncbi:MAG: asparagine synthase (glutamine-hydrolyzing) [Flavobacterium sp.]|uniref:asparagine synthase (glutamine-hydrolyzing) n=1 Tax=unclassified Flavobacterium TaxID=196869 RepID=UPI000C375CD7|nr:MULTISPECIES: asparagine synthase (glutamine-hydrolyzing) [unclassified Flavobacterium]MBF02171.1 asparagine synthase (glutamine-hydrolyzing) [Flavobacterium sp.]MCO6164209.1 asparagine synthase (glutamine-hydrolyzing) [Flavobacterium sp. NRK F7]|tara:strand:- start:179 stop:1882 length:1704 start_codon:yes stop_codon:yes gene_type:complete